MKAKPLIGQEDFKLVDSGYFSKKIPRLKLGGLYSVERGHFNYGASLTSNYANQKIAPLLNALVTYFYSDKEDEKCEAYETIKEYAEQYK